MCLNQGILPNHTHTHTQTHTYVYTYIYIYIYKMKKNYKTNYIVYFKMLSACFNLKSSAGEKDLWENDSWIRSTNQAKIVKPKLNLFKK